MLTARKVEPKHAVLWMQMQQDAQVAVCVDSTSRTVEVSGLTRHVLAPALYVEEMVRSSRGTARDWDPNTKMHLVRKVLAMEDYGGARGSIKGHTIQVVTPQASATAAADQEVTDLAQDGLTWWVPETRGGRRTAVVYTRAPFERVERRLMRWVGEAEEVGLGRTEEMRTTAILRALESQMGRGTAAEEAEDIKEQIRLALEWPNGCKEGEQLRWMVSRGTEEGARQESLARARKPVEDAQKQGAEMEEDPEGGRQDRWRGFRRGMGGQMRFIVGDRVNQEQRDGEAGQAQEEEDREPRLEVDAEVGHDGVGEKEKEWAREKQRWWTGTRGVRQEKVRRDRRAGGIPETTEQGTGTSGNGDEECQGEPERMSRGADDAMPKWKR